MGPVDLRCLVVAEVGRWQCSFVCLHGGSRAGKGTDGSQHNYSTWTDCVNLLEVLDEACPFCQGNRLLPRRLSDVRLVLFQLKVDVVIFRLSPNTKPPSLQPGKQYSNKFAKARRIEDRDSLSSTTRSIVGIHSASRNRSFAFCTYLIYPARQGTLDLMSETV